jgi:Periplasmic binding protein-like domain
MPLRSRGEEGIGRLFSGSATPSQLVEIDRADQSTHHPSRAAKETRAPDHDAGDYLQVVRQMATEGGRGEPRKCIFCYKDCVAADIVDACVEADIQIPDRVAVLGVDNDPVICDCVQVPLSSVRHDLESMAYETAALLDRLFNGESPPEMPLRIAPKGVATSEEHRGTREWNSVLCCCRILSNISWRLLCSSKCAVLPGRRVLQGVR